MSVAVILHLTNQDPVVGELEKLPEQSDQVIIIHNPRLKDGKDLHYLASNVVTVYWPIEQISFIEILQGEEEEPVIGFVRE